MTTRDDETDQTLYFTDYYIRDEHVVILREGAYAILAPSALTLEPIQNQSDC